MLWAVLSLADPRRCIFCGQKPLDKNREHVLPQWILERTGDPTRVVTLGQDYSKGKGEIRYSWSNYVAPACERCNATYSALEKRAEQLTSKLENRQAISVGDYVALLDWLDKVRVGVWLLRHMIENHSIEITPNFYISSRVATKDRMLALYVFGDQPKGINLVGSDSMVFSDMPSCFGLRMNNLLMLNISYDFFCSRGCGLPYPHSMKLLKGGEDSRKMLLEGVSGPQKVSSPVTRIRLFKPVIWLYQAIKLPSSDPAFPGGYFGHVNLTDTRTIPLTLEGSPQQGAIVRQFSNHVEVLRNPASLVPFDTVAGNDSVKYGNIAASIYDAQALLYSGIQYEWIEPPAPPEEHVMFRKMVIENTREFAEQYRRAVNSH